MRRPAILLSLLVSLSLALMPFGILHAHMDSGHEQVLVHGGHSHDLDLPEDHHAQHHDESAKQLGDVVNVAHPDYDHSANHHVVHLHSDADDLAALPLVKLGKVVSESNARPPDLPHRAALTQQFSSSDGGFFCHRAYLHPPLRGPPAAIPQAI